MVELGVIDHGFPTEVEDDEADELQREEEQSAMKLVDDLHLFEEEQGGTN
jgi:hypothetical protein